MSEFSPDKIEVDYQERFGEGIVSTYLRTESQYVKLLLAAEKAIKRGRKLSLKESHKAMGMVYDPTVVY